MRTTLSLDPDVAALVAREVERTKRPMKTVVNEKLRRGFADRPEKSSAGSPLLPQALKLGKAKVQNFDNVAEILELIADDSR